jgi:hypothetical protein
MNHPLFSMVNVMSQVLKEDFMKKMFVILVSLFFTVMLVSVSYSADSKPAEAKKPTIGEVKTSGVMYINYIYNVDDLGTGKSFNKFDIERTYLTFESSIADKAKIKVTTDIYQNAKSVSIKAEDGSKADNTDVKSVTVASYYDGWSVRLKNAYVDLDLIPMTTIRAGMIGTPWIPTVEKAWGYRFVKPTLTDALKLFSSADMGAAAIVKIPQGYGEFMLAVLNGVGYSKPEDDKYKDICPRITITPMPKDAMLKGLGISAYYYMGKKASGDDSLDRTRLGAMLNFSYDFINVGGEFDMSTDQSLDKNSAKLDTNGSGFSVFGDIKFTKFLPAPLNNLGVLARFDSWDPNTDTENDGNRVILAGLTYNVAKNVRAVLDLQQTSYQAADKDSTSQIMAQVEVKF